MKATSLCSTSVLLVVRLMWAQGRARPRRGVRRDLEGCDRSPQPSGSSDIRILPHVCRCLFFPSEWLEPISTSFHKQSNAIAIARGHLSLYLMKPRSIHLLNTRRKDFINTLKDDKYTLVLRVTFPRNVFLSGWTFHSIMMNDQQPVSWSISRRS